VLNENFGDLAQRFSPRPIALPFAKQGNPGDKCYTGLHHAPDCHVVGFGGQSARSVGYDIHIVIFAPRWYCTHRQTHLGPERRDDEFLWSERFHSLDDALILPSVMKVRLISFDRERPAPSLRPGEADVSSDRLSSIVGPEPESANNNSAKKKWRRRPAAAAPTRRLEQVALPQLPGIGARLVRAREGCE
jgi:hypothetical protein